jgi:phosphatidylserine decarboxylase
MEVGAMLVGRIVNHEEKGSTIRGKEKGYFQYGGSTIIVLIEPEQVQIREDILQSSALTKEVPVKMGEVIGHALEHKRTIQ